MCKGIDHSTDGELVIRAREGDKAAFAALVERYAQLAFTTARSRVRDRATASDVVQEGFIVAFERLGRLREPDRFGRWLRKIVIAECARLVRQERISSNGTSQLALLETTADAAAELEEDDGALGRAAMSLILTLPPAQGEAATLCLVQGVSRTSAAAFLGVEETTLRKRLHDARKRLQREVFRLASTTFREHQLPAGFTERCVCRCERSQRNNNESVD